MIKVTILPGLIDETAARVLATDKNVFLQSLLIEYPVLMVDGGVTFLRQRGVNKRERAPLPEGITSEMIEIIEGKKTQGGG